MNRIISAAVVTCLVALGFMLRGNDVSDNETTTEVNLTLNQIELARHALGLSVRNSVSYRNYFVASPGHSDYDAWCHMVSRGFARVRPGYKLPFGGDDCFHLTRAAAQAALLPREELAPEFRE